MIRIVAAGDRPDPGQRLEQLRLAVAGDARDADDLAGAHLEADALDPGHTGAIAHAQAFDLEHGCAGPSRRLLDPEQDLAPDHQLGELLGRGLGRAPVRDHRSLAHDRDVVGRGHDLAQLVGDQHDRSTLVAQVAEDAEQMVRLLRRQHPGRLVENQDARAPKQRLQDLDPLLDADRELAHRRIEVDVEAVLALEPGDLGAGARRAGRERRAALGAEQQVLQDRERLDQHEVLMHHADAGCDRVLGALDLAILAVDPDDPPIGLVEAVEDVHQGGLAGAVLADDAVDRAARDREVDVLVGVDRAEVLVDTEQLDRRRLIRRRPAARARDLAHGRRRETTGSCTGSP